MDPRKAASPLCFTYPLTLKTNKKNTLSKLVQRKSVKKQKPLKKASSKDY